MRQSLWAMPVNVALARLLYQDRLQIYKIPALLYARGQRRIRGKDLDRVALDASDDGAVLRSLDFVSVEKMQPPSIK